jgi:hypothetical protein
MARGTFSEDVTLATWAPVVASTSAVAGLAPAWVIAAATSLEIGFGVGVLIAAGSATGWLIRRRGWAAALVAGVCAALIFIALVAAVIEATFDMPDNW